MKTIRSLSRIVVSLGPGLWLAWIALIGTMLLMAIFGGTR